MRSLLRVTLQTRLKPTNFHFAGLANISMKLIHFGFLNVPNFLDLINKMNINI